MLVLIHFLHKMSTSRIDYDGDKTRIIILAPRLSLCGSCIVTLPLLSNGSIEVQGCVCFLMNLRTDRKAGNLRQTGPPPASASSSSPGWDFSLTTTYIPRSSRAAFKINNDVKCSELFVNSDDTQRIRGKRREECRSHNWGKSKESPWNWFGGTGVLREDFSYWVGKMKPMCVKNFRSSCISDEGHM